MRARQRRERPGRSYGSRSTRDLFSPFGPACSQPAPSKGGGVGFPPRVGLSHSMGSALDDEEEARSCRGSCFLLEEQVDLAPGGRGVNAK
jgi:hypothetical protein